MAFDRFTPYCQACSPAQHSTLCVAATCRVGEAVTLCWRLERSPGAAAGHDSNTVQYDVTSIVRQQDLQLNFALRDTGTHSCIVAAVGLVIAYFYCALS